MTGSRCPACGAATPETVPWCSLCYADLRPVPAAAVPAPRTLTATDAPSGVPGPSDDTAPDPLTAPISSLLQAPSEVVRADATATDTPEPSAQPSPDSPAVVDPLVAAATWPCARCHALVPLLLDACNECGAGFLEGAIPPPTMSVPMVGDVSRLSKGQRFGLAAGLAVAIIAVFLVLATIAAVVF